MQSQPNSSNTQNNVATLFQSSQSVSQHTSSRFAELNIGASL